MTDQLEAALNPFIEHPAELHERPAAGGVQWEFHFPNGYGASVVCGPYSYGGPSGLWEVAVLSSPDWDIDYSTPVTYDVLGYQTVEEVREVLRRIADLPRGD